MSAGLPAAARAGVIWLTGLPAAGKTTLGQAITNELRTRRPCCLIDGDLLRSGLSADLGLSREDRSEQSRRAAHVAALLAVNGVFAVVALVSPFAEDRARARRIAAEADVAFAEVWVNTPLEVCRARDPKGLYARAQAGEISDLTGVDAPYEAPQAADLRVNTDEEAPAAAARRILAFAAPE